MIQPVLIIGAGGFAREVFDWIDKEQFQVVGAYSDSPEDKARGFRPGVPVYDSFSELRHISYVCAVGDPLVREGLCRAAESFGLVPSLPIIHYSAIVGTNSSIARGGVVCPNVVITCDVRIRMGVIVNLGATVGHDSLIEDFVTVSPGANISGNVILKRGCYIGTNAAILERVTVGEYATVGMGAAVVKGVPPGSVFGGVPARDLALRAIST